MDEFLREIYVDVFKYWILNQDCEDYHIYLYNEDTIHIETKYSLTKIIFYEMSIIEFRVKNTISNNVEFYLHFQMKTLKHATDLFYEMLEIIKGLVEKPVTKVLLTCSGGLTTTYFASEIKKGAEVLHYPIEVSAVGYNQLFNIGEDYDVILIAPQISYIYPKVKEILKDKIVLKIPSKIFASYNVGEMLDLIKQETRKKREIKESKIISLKREFKVKKKILCLSIFRNSNRVHIAFCKGDQEGITGYDEYIKPTINIDDFYGVIDTLLVKYEDIEIIGISIPGIIIDGYVSGGNIPGFKDCDLLGLLKERYDLPIILENDVNTAAAGYYASNDQYNSLTFLFKPQNTQQYNNMGAGAGTIINGELICGEKNLAGEVKYLPLNLSKPIDELNCTPEGCLEVVAKMFVTIISIISPQLLVLYCVLIPDIEELKEEMSKYLPVEYIPPMIKIDDMIGYTLIGVYILCSKI